jgi:uracil-DNA glycosylase
MSKINIHPSWLKYLSDEFKSDYMSKIKLFLKKELEAGKIVYPHGKDIFQAFNKTPFDRVKVVIIGQDPYHGENQAHGMSFSVQKRIKTPPSLVNIFKELETDLGIERSSHGNLEAWADQGVLLLNSVLTVEAANAGSHRKKGWETFTDKVIQTLNDEKENIVFLLWGAPAQKKASIVDESKHLVLKAPHPSPLSSYRGFFGCKHFSQTNDYLKIKNIETIDWALPQD